MSTLTRKKMVPAVSILDRPLRILHLEDNMEDHRMIQRSLAEQGIAAEFTNVYNESDFSLALERKSFDIILSDKCMPGFDGLAALRYVREYFPHIPFVFVTGSMGEEAAIGTMRDGAIDYVLKDRLSRLIPAVQRAIRESEQGEKSRHMEEKNREQAALLDKAQDAIFVIDINDTIQFWNKSAERIYGWPASSILGRKATDLLPANLARYDEVKQILLEKGGWRGELAVANRGGNELFVESRWTLVRNEEGNPKSILIIDTDITQKKEMETRYLRSQRLDSIGALAGGIAHDLNNALAPVLMGTELLRDCEDRGSREKFLDIIFSNAQRASELVKQILSFARGSGGQTGPVQLKHLIGDMGKMIQDTFPKSIVLTVKISGGELSNVQGDATEFHQVLMNLCVNARDAMPKGGELTIRAHNLALEGTTALALGAPPGSYVMISVADTGTGIPPKVLPHIFEPFFTTKKGDKGTGLGLATVAGIIRHHRGFIDIHTESGKGTEFKIYFPAIDGIEPTVPEPKKDGPPLVILGHGELILLIDDEETLLEMTKTMLESYGYQVVISPNGLQGVARFKENQNEIKLVITDTDMPFLDGEGVIRAIQELKPDMPIIIASGSKQSTANLQQVNSLHLESLEKPFTLEQLLIAVDLGLHR